MNNKSTDKYSFLGMVPVCIILAILFSFIAVRATHGTRYLAENEITHYAQVAESIWNNDTQVIDSTLQYKVTDESVKISSYNMFEQTVTVFFTEEGNNIVVNEPSVNFTCCCIFFSWLAAISFLGAITFTSVTIDEFRFSKWKKKFSSFYINEKKSKKSRE